MLQKFLLLISACLISYTQTQSEECIGNYLSQGSCDCNTGQQALKLFGCKLKNSRQVCPCPGGLLVSSSKSCSCSQNIRPSWDTPPSPGSQNIRPSWDTPPSPGSQNIRPSWDTPPSPGSQNIRPSWDTPPSPGSQNSRPSWDTPPSPGSQNIRPPWETPPSPGPQNFWPSWDTPPSPVFPVQCFPYCGYDKMIKTAVSYNPCLRKHHNGDMCHAYKSCYDNPRLYFPQIQDRQCGNGGPYCALKTDDYEKKYRFIVPYKPGGDLSIFYPLFFYYRNKTPSSYNRFIRKKDIDENYTDPDCIIGFLVYKKICVFHRYNYWNCKIPTELC